MTAHPGRLHRDCGLGVALTADLCTDAAALAVLSIQRHLCRAFANPGCQGWMAGLVIAVEALGDVTGPRLFAAVTAQMQAMRQARGNMFTYADPLCPDCRQALTPDEEQLTLCLRALRGRRELAAGRHALALCEGEPPTRFLYATAHVVDLLLPLRDARMN